MAIEFARTGDVPAVGEANRQSQRRMLLSAGRGVADAEDRRAEKAGANFLELSRAEANCGGAAKDQRLSVGTAWLNSRAERAIDRIAGLGQWWDSVKGDNRIEGSRAGFQADSALAAMDGVGWVDGATGKLFSEVGIRAARIGNAAFGVLDLAAAVNRDRARGGGDHRETAFETAKSVAKSAAAGIAAGAVGVAAAGSLPVLAVGGAALAAGVAAGWAAGKVVDLFHWWE